MRAQSKYASVLPLPLGDRVPDRVLVEQALRHDKRAEEAIYLRHVGHVNAVCLRLLRAPAEVEDVVQDTFVDVFLELSKLRDPDRLRDWITRIAVHKVHRRFRRRRLAQLLALQRPSEEPLCTLSALPSLSPELRAELARLDRALGSVPEVARSAWLLRYVEGYALSEVATLCRCSLPTVKRRIALAQSRLRIHIQPEGDAHG